MEPAIASRSLVSRLSPFGNLIENPSEWATMNRTFFFVANAFSAAALDGPLLLARTIDGGVASVNSAWNDCHCSQSEGENPSFPSSSAVRGNPLITADSEKKSPVRLDQ